MRKPTHSSGSLASIVTSVTGSMAIVILAMPAIARAGDASPKSYKLVEVKKGSIYEKIGLKKGDMIRTIDGHTMDENPQISEEPFPPAPGHHEITIIRNGKEETLKIDVKED